jgi:hypothetical protein
MGIAQFPAAAGGLSSVVKSVQRGVAASAGNVTITAVDVAKTLVNSFSTSSTGTVAASGSVSSQSGTASAFSISATTGNAALPSSRYSGTGGAVTQQFNLNGTNANSQNLSLNAQNLSGGTTNLIAGVNGAYLSNSTTLVVTGPCRYEVVEYF